MDRDVDDDHVIIERPNRAKASSKVTRAIVVLVLLASILLLLVVTVGGWDHLQGAKALQIFYILVYALGAGLVVRWNRGILPVLAALAIVLLIFALVSAGGWFDRDAPGFASSAIDAEVLGLLCMLLVPVQALLLVASMVAFRQAWNVEVEHYAGGSAPPAGRTAPAPA